MNETILDYWENIEVFMENALDFFVLILILIAFVCIGGSVGGSSERQKWHEKIKSSDIIEVDGRYYEVKEVLLLKSYKEK